MLRARGESSSLSRGNECIRVDLGSKVHGIAHVVGSFVNCVVASRLLPAPQSAGDLYCTLVFRRAPQGVVKSRADAHPESTAAMVWPFFPKIQGTWLMTTIRFHGLVAPFILCAFSVAVLSAADEPAADVSIEPSELLKKLTEGRQAIQNARTKCVWQSREGGSVASQSQEFFWDDLGRRRITTYLVPQAGQPASTAIDRDCVTDTTYDGELVSLCKTYPFLNRFGKDPETSEEKKLGYSPVIIGDASSSIRSLLEGERNPFEYISNAVIPTMQEALKHHSVSVSAVDSEGIVRAEITNEHVGTNGIARSVIEIVPARQWLVTSVKGYSPQGDCINSLSFKYRQQDDGLWVPTEGEHRIWNPDTPPPANVPIIDWHCEVQDARYNDPKFDASVFAITLKPDAAVSDTRYNITYRVGDQEANTAQMQRYVTDAMNKLNHREPESIGKTSRLRIPMVLTINALTLLAGIAIYVVSIRKKRTTGDIG